jgi:hypothetical protein
MLRKKAIGCNDVLGGGNNVKCECEPTLRSTPSVKKPAPKPAGPFLPKNLTYEQARQQYLKEYPDVRNAGVDPWDHFVHDGKREGRQWRGAGKPPAPQPKPVPPPAAPVMPSNLPYEQARQQYLNEYPDVRNAGVDPWDHYVNNGQYEGRQWRGESKPPAPQPQPVPQPQPPPQNNNYSAIDTQMQQFLQDWPASQFYSTAQSDGSCQGQSIESTYDVGGSIESNKARILEACNSLGLSDTVKRMMIAYAMIETNDLSVYGRDSSKDGNLDAANYGCFNLNGKMIRMIGLPEISDSDLVPVASSKLNQDSQEAVTLMVKLIVTGMNMWGLDKYVSFVRGGETLFYDNADYRNDNYGGFKVKVFKCGFSYIHDKIKDDPSLLTDRRRVALCIPWV